MTETDTQNYTVKSVIADCVRLLGIEGKFDLGNAEDADTRFFVALLSMISTGIAYRLPLETTETVTTDDRGKVRFGALSKPYVKLVSVCAPDGAPQKAELKTDGFVTLANASVDVRYVWSPAALELFGIMPYTPADCSKNVFVYALCAQYCFVEGMTEESERWRNLYAQEFYNSTRTKNAYMQSRDWL